MPDQFQSDRSPREAPTQRGTYFLERDSSRKLDINKLLEHPRIKRNLTGSRADQCLFIVALQLYNEQIETVFATVASAMGWAMKLKAVHKALFPEQKVAFRFINGKESWSITDSELRQLQIEAVAAKHPEQSLSLWPLIASINYGDVSGQVLMHGHSSLLARGLTPKASPYTRQIASRILEYSKTYIGRYVVFEECEETGETARYCTKRLAVLLARNTSAHQCDTMHLQGRSGYADADSALYSEYGKRVDPLGVFPSDKPGLSLLHERYQWGRSYGEKLHVALQELEVPISNYETSAKFEERNVCVAVQDRFKAALDHYSHWLPSLVDLSQGKTGLDQGMTLIIDCLRFPGFWGLNSVDRAELETVFRRGLTHVDSVVAPIIYAAVYGALDTYKVPLSADTRSLFETWRSNKEVLSGNARTILQQRITSIGHRSSSIMAGVSELDLCNTLLDHLNRCA